MYDSVRNNFISFTTTFEGKIAYMYLDIKGYVTIGIGNLIDPVESALGLSFVHKSDGTPASADEIRAEWNAVKANTGLAQKGAGAAAAVTSLKLTDDAIEALVLSKLDAAAATLKNTSEFSGFEGWPADAQLGILSMAWAMGAGFGPGWPTFRAACAAGDWAAAGAASHIDDTGNPGVTPRNAADVKLFANAAAVIAAKSDLTTLWYPNAPSAPSSTPDGGTDGGGSNAPGDGGTSTGAPSNDDPSTPE